MSLPGPPYPRTPRRPARMGPGSWVAVVVTLALVATVGFRGVRAAFRSCGGLRSGVRTIDGECIGVSDRFAFGNVNGDVMEKIAAANDAIGSSQAVTVAVLGSFTTDPSSPVPAASMRRQLLGAYLAQWRFNEGKDARSIRMKIVVANWGSHEKQWPQAVHDLVERKDDEEAPLVAVTGFGASLTETESAAKALSAAGLPMVGTVTTADQLTAIDGFFRVSPPNRDYVASLAAYARRTKGLERAVLVADQTPAENDLFTADLAEELRNAFKDRIGNRPVLPFVGSQNPGGASPAAFNVKISRICDESSDVQLLLYAGRSNDLNQLFQALLTNCVDHGITVMTGGSDDLNRFKTVETKLAKQHLRLVYASGTDPANWIEGRNAPPGLEDFRRVLDLAGFREDEISGGSLLSGYDSVLTVAKAIDLAQEETADLDGYPVNGANIRSQMLNINDADRVRGATGDFGFQARDDRTGDPVGKSVPIVTIPYSPQSPADLYVTKADLPVGP